ncbi:conserved Plasmodium protein, unknown function [Plasmodium gallinaceum]|uniref:Uncharacterized protein n=1 Tax=Plasmodium gallinaceum TaxID=5849 RepID=A0A1J1H1H6_PLAGA|nr:conserved Plasmodium protein, unknown function [Plasmodium gallinaceum]CRG97379.1 conserved Plasmodium protein, unknown function [Plasmodium gallinaceum]
MIYNKYIKKFKNTKRKYCDVLENNEKENNNSSNSFLLKDLLKNLILKFYFKTILDKIYENYQKNNYFFEVFIYIDVIKLIDSNNSMGYYIMKNYIEFANSFNETSYILLSEFLKNFKENKQTNINLSVYLDIIIKNKFFIIFLIPLNTPIKTDCILNLGKSNKLENNFYNIIEIINATLISKDKKSFLYKSFYMRICECSSKYLPHQNVIVKINKLGDLYENKEAKEICKLCYSKEYEEIINKRKFKNFFTLKFFFSKTIDEYNNKDEYTTFEVLFQDINEKTENFEIGMKYNLIIVSIPNKLNKNNIKGLHVGSLWLLNHRKNIIKTRKFEYNMLSLSTNVNTLLSTECFNYLLNSQNLNDMNSIIIDILKLPQSNSVLNKICKTTKLTLILISISNNFLKYLNLNSFAYDIFNKVNKNKRYKTFIKENISAKGMRAPHCFFICLDEILMIEMVKFCNFFCNIKLLNVKKDSFNILLTQKYDILVININNLNNSQIKILVEIMKNGIYRNKKFSIPVSTTFWVYSEFNFYINENLLARFDFLFELGFEKDEDIIDEILGTVDNTNIENFDYYFDLNNKYSYLRKNNLSYFEFNEINNISKSIIHKYFNMASDLSTLTIYHIGISELLCISVSILLKKKECLIEHVVLGLFLYDKFVSSTKNKLTQFDKNILNSIINPKQNQITSFQKLMNYFSSYLNATMDL